MRNYSIAIMLSIGLFSSSCSVGIEPAVQNSNGIYYIDSSTGNDSASGTSPSTAWQSLDHISSSGIKAGDAILLKRGCTFRGQIVPISGYRDQPTHYGAYGSGAKPLLLGSINKSKASDWILDDGNLYYCAQTSPYDIGNLIFNHETSVGVKKWSLNELTAQGDYYYDSVNQRLYLFSTGNPALIYQDIECALDRYIINESNRSCLLFDNLDLRYGAANGIGGGNTSCITISNCDFSYIGGAFLYKAADGSMIRYGNAVEFQRNAHDNIVENCRFDQIFDTAVTNQSNADVVAQYNIIYRNNIIKNFGMAAVEIWVRVSGSTVRDITFEHNSCYNAGGGWSATQNRQSSFGTGHQVVSFGSAGIPERINIRNNIFHTAINPDPDVASAILIQPMPGQSNAQANFTFDYNCYFGNGTKLGIFWSTEGGTPIAYLTDDTSTYRNSTGQDSHSLFVDPLWENIGEGNFLLKTTSPCRNTGLNGSSNTDLAGNHRPMGSIADIGAYEFVE